MKPHSFKGSSSAVNSSGKSVLTTGSDRKNSNYDMDHSDLG